MEKSYIYRAYRAGVFLGVLPNVTSEFYYSNRVNSAGCQVVVEVALTPDTVQEPLEPLLDEDGETLLDENNQPLYPERAPDVVGDGNTDALIRTNNDIQIWEVSEHNPNGIKVFEGYISKYRTRTKDGEDTVVATLLSFGADLDNYIIESGSTVDESNDGSTASQVLGNSKFDERDYLYQSFVIGSGVTTLRGIALKLAAYSSNYIGASVVVEMFNNQVDAESFSSTPVQTKAINVTSTTAAEYLFLFDEPIAVVAGQTWYARYSADWYGFSIPYDSHITTYTDGAGNYAAGVRRGWIIGFGGWQTSPYDSHFKTYKGGGATTAEYTSEDPSNILRDILDNFVGQGGAVDYDGTSIEDTGESVSYTFKVNTVLEGLRKCLDLAPSNWYFSVDPADNLVYFKEADLAAPAHTMVRGKHLSGIETEVSIEELRNKIYFTGGDTGAGENLYSIYTDSDAIEDNAGRVRVDRLSDNRVTLQATADTLAEGFLAENSEAKGLATITVLDSEYDTSSMKLGESVGFAGFGNFIDELVLQIVELEKDSKGVRLSLGVLPRRQSRTFEQVRRDLAALQTIDNPDSPS